MPQPAFAFRLGLLATACLLVACQTKAPTTTAPRPGRTPAVGPSAGPAGLPSGGLVPPATEALRPLGPGLAAQVLTGEVRLLSNHGAGLLSDAGGAVLSNRSGQLLSNHGGGLIGDQGSGLISNNAGAFRLAQAEGAASGVGSFRLAEAEVELLDGEGRRLAGPDGKPLVATTDAQGRYRLEANLPSEGLVLRVRLFQGGALVGLLPKGRAAQLNGFDLDPERSLGSRYVLDRIAPSRPKLLDAVEAEGLERVRQALKAAGVAKALGQAPSYEAGAQVAVAQALRGRDACVDEAFAAIERLVGQASFGQGRAAMEVSLSQLGGLGLGPKGELFVFEGVGRLRELLPDGAFQLIAGLGSTGPEMVLQNDLDVLPDGSVLLSEMADARVARLAPPSAPGGTWTRELAIGVEAPSGLNLPAPQALGVAPDGSVVLVEGVASGAAALPVWRWEVQAKRLSPLLPLPRPFPTRTPMVREVGVEPGGAIVVAVSTRGNQGAQGEVWRLGAEAGATWQRLQAQVQLQRGLVVGEGGELWWADDEAHVVRHRKPDGTLEVLAGQAGRSGFAGDGGPATQALLQQPGELLRAADGGLVVSDDGNGVVRLVDPQGVIRSVAGRPASRAVGDLNGLPVNAPWGLALSEDGQSLWVGEHSAHTVKRIVGGRAELYAGGQRGFDGDGGDRLQAAFQGVSALASDRQGGLFLVDPGNDRVRRIDAQGRVSTLAGPTFVDAQGQRRDIGTACGLAVSPDGRTVCWGDTDLHVVVAVGPDGVPRVILGQAGAVGDGEEGVAGTACRIFSPAGLVYGPDGTLYVAEMGNQKVRALSPDGLVRTVAGRLSGGTATLLAGRAKLPSGPDALATEVDLAVPVSLTMAPDGALIMGELGTENLQALRKVGLRAALATLPPEIVPVPPRVSRIDLASGAFQALAGWGTQALLEGENRLYFPMGLAFAPDGRLAVADAFANQIWAIRYGAGASCAAP